jgi:hypothetical protein
LILNHHQEATEGYIDWDVYESNQTLVLPNDI